MKDFLKSYVLVSAGCGGFWVYNWYYPLVNFNFISYNTPLIACQFVDDFDFMKFCEGYDYYTEQTPEIGMAKTDTQRFQQFGIIYTDVAIDERVQQTGLSVYPVLKIDGMDIHFLHDVIKRGEKEFHQTISFNEESRQTWASEENMLAKWRGRTNLGKGLKKIFLWDAATFQSVHTESERAELLSRFHKLDGHTIFLTERENEHNIVTVGGLSRVTYYNSTWEGKLQTDRRPHDGGLVWKDQGRASLFARIIDEIRVVDEMVTFNNTIRLQLETEYSINFKWFQEKFNMGEVPLKPPTRKR